MPTDLYEEYKFIAQDSANIAARYQNLSTVYMAFDTFLLGGVAAVLASIVLPLIDSALSSPPTSSALARVNLVSLGLVLGLIAFACFIGALISVTWQRQAGNYRRLLEVRNKMLVSIESRVGFSGTILYSVPSVVGINPLTGMRVSSRSGDVLATAFTVVFGWVAVNLATSAVILVGMATTLH